MTIVEDIRRVCEVFCPESMPCDRDDCPARKLRAFADKLEALPPDAVTPLRRLGDWENDVAATCVRYGYDLAVTEYRDRADLLRALADLLEGQ